MLSRNEFRQHPQNLRAGKFIRDHHIEKAVVRQRVGYSFHTAADIAAIANGKDGNFRLFRFSVQRDFHRQGAEVFQSGKDAQQIRKEAFSELFETGCLAQNLHVKAGTGNIDKMHLVQAADVDPSRNAGELCFQRFDRILRKRQHFHEIIPCAAGNKVQGGKPARKAVDYLNKSVNTSLDEDKSYITYPVALGIQARIALSMEDWGTAARAAEAVINLNKYTIQPVAASAFKKNTSNFINNVGAGNVMWGAGIIADQSGIYASLYAHMDHDADMYGGYDAAPKRINADTYNLMGAADTRRCWWNPDDENNPYQQEKMHFSDINTYLGDYVYMRIEEMYLAAAEAECMQGNEDAARNYLNTLVKTRDANYNCTATGTAMGKLTSDRTGSLREAIIDQRRIELWGEYGRLYDIKRLKQGFIRTVAQGWPNDPNILLTNRPSDDPENYMWVLTIPQAEFDGNASLDPTKDQNPTGDK